MSVAEGGWHLDKKVSIGIIVALAIQTVTFAVMGSRWMAITDARLSYLESTISASSGQDGRIIRLETRFDAFARTLDIIENKLDRALNRMTGVDGP